MTQRLFLAAIGTLLLAASLPGIAAAGSDPGDTRTTTDTIDSVVGDPSTELAGTKLDIGHRVRWGFWRWWQNWRCQVYARHAPRYYDRFCGGNNDAPSPTATPVPTSTPIPTDTPTPVPTLTPTPEPTATPTPTPVPMGQAAFTGERLVFFLQGPGASSEFGFDMSPGGGAAVGGEYAWTDGVYNVTFSRNATGFTFISYSGAGPSQFASRSTTAVCGAWDTLQVAMIAGGGEATMEFRDVTIDGVAAGDLLDNGDGVAANDFWTFAGDYADGVSVTGQLVISGWSNEESPRPRLEVTVGCAE
ncbi:MAG: hypothetical protein R3C29_12910 [Dehalococcoidia bacterium]